MKLNDALEASALDLDGREKGRDRERDRDVMKEDVDDSAIPFFANRYVWLPQTDDPWNTYSHAHTNACIRNTRTFS